jgi:hypothetical protein
MLFGALILGVNLTVFLHARTSAPKIGPAWTTRSARSTAVYVSADVELRQNFESTTNVQQRHLQPVLRVHHRQRPLSQEPQRVNTLVRRPDADLHEAAAHEKRAKAFHDKMRNST